MTDHYSIIEEAARELIIKELPAYFNAARAHEQVTKSDDTVYDKGHEFFVTSYPGSFPTVREGVQSIEVTWEVLLDVLCRWSSGRMGSDADTWNKFIAFRSDLFNLFNATNKGRNLDRAPGVRSVLFGSEDRPRYIPLRADSPDTPPAFIAQVCTLSVAEVINKT